MVFGPAIGGWLSAFTMSTPFLAAGGLAAVILAFAFFLLEESLAEPVPAEKQESGLPISPKVLQHRLLPLFSVALVANMIMSLFESTFALFASARVGFGPAQVGTVFAVIGVIGIIVQGGLVGRLSRRFGDARLIMGAMVIALTGLSLLVFAPNAALVIGFTAFFSSGNSVLRPTIPSLVSKVAEEGQGEAVGKMQSFSSLGRVIGPIAGGAIYDINMNAPYITCSLVVLVTLLVVRERMVKCDEAVERSAKSPP
jgi:MFS family permease